MSAFLIGASGTDGVNKRINVDNVLYFDVTEDPLEAGTYVASAHMTDGTVIPVLSSASGATYVRAHLDAALNTMFGLWFVTS